MNEKLDQPIAYGRTAEIYAWDNGQVVKLFYDWLGLEAIQYERRIAQAVGASGLPVPAVGDIIRINERNGLIYQQVTGVSMLAIISRKPWHIFGYARRMAELHVAMHERTVEVDIPSQRQKLSHKIGQAAALPADLRAKALAALETMPGGNRLCHGDFHPDNILLTEQGEMIID